MGEKGDIKRTRVTVKDWLKVLVLLLDEIAALLLVIFLLRYFEIKLPLPVIIVLAVIAGTLIFLVHKALIPSFHRKQVTGREGMIGRQCRVVEALTPRGAVIVEGERWKAKSADENIEVDVDVEIIAIDRLTLRVQRKE
jgi:membrane-bound serine protease (ClpP class)